MRGIHYLVIAVIGFLLYFKDQIVELFREKGNDPNSQNLIPNLIHQSSPPVNFNAWLPDSYKDLVAGGYTVVARSWDYFIKLSNDIKSCYGYLVSNDNRVLGYIYSVKNKCEFNKLVSAFAQTQSMFNHDFTSLLQFCESELDNENVLKIKEFVNKLPNGYYAA